MLAEELDYTGWDPGCRRSGEASSRAPQEEREAPVGWWGCKLPRGPSQILRLETWGGAQHSWYLKSVGRKATFLY